MLLRTGLSRNFPGSEIDTLVNYVDKTPQLPTLSAPTTKSLAKRNGFQTSSDSDEFPTKNGDKRLCMNQHDHKFSHISALQRLSTQSELKSLAKRNEFRRSFDDVDAPTINGHEQECMDQHEESGCEEG